MVAGKAVRSFNVKHDQSLGYWINSCSEGVRTDE